MISEKNAGWIKTAVIVLLTVSAILLGWQTRLFNDFFTSIPIFNGVAELIKGTPATVEPAGGAVLGEAARPSAIVITNETGGHYGVRYDTDTKNTVYMRTSGILGETLGSASPPAEISEEVWREALHSPGIYFEYLRPVKLSILGGWLGLHMTVQDTGASLRRVCVTFGGEMNSIYFQDAESGLFYEAAAVSTGARVLELGTYEENGTVFAFETGLDTAQYEPYMLLFPESRHPVLRASPPASEQEPLDIILAAFGVGSQIKPSYSAADGALVYVGTQFSVRVGPDGYAVFTLSENARTESAPAADENEMIERARITAADTVGVNCGEAEVQFAEASYGADGAFAADFSYTAAGGLINTGEDGRAARITFRNGVITEMELRFRRYIITDEHIKLLPEKLALAAAGEEFLLCYNDFGYERLVPEWNRRRVIMG